MIVTPKQLAAELAVTDQAATGMLRQLQAADGLHECTWEWSVGPYGPIRAYALAMAGRDGCRIIPRLLIETLASG